MLPISDSPIAQPVFRTAAPTNTNVGTGFGFFHQPPPTSTIPPSPLPTQSTTPTPSPASSGTPMNALNAFANSAGMQFQLQQGANALQNLYAAKGALQSGAAMKALQNYGQQTALQNYFMPYMSLLQGQQNVGAQAGSAVAGVGSNYSNTAAGIYGGMSNAIGNGADAASNAALLNGQINGNLGSSIGSALGTFGSSFFTPSTTAPASSGQIVVNPNYSLPFSY